MQVGSTVSYFGNNQVEIMALGKFVGKNGKVIVYSKESEKALIRQNAEFNGVISVMELHLASETPASPSDFIISKSISQAETLFLSKKFQNSVILFEAK